MVKRFLAKEMMQVQFLLRWNESATRRVEPCKRGYYAFENRTRVLEKYLFDTLVTPILLYGVEVWGGSIPEST